MEYWIMREFEHGMFQRVFQTGNLDELNYMWDRLRGDKELTKFTCISVQVLDIKVKND